MRLDFENLWKSVRLKDFDIALLSVYNFKIANWEGRHIGICILGFQLGIEL